MKNKNLPLIIGAVLIVLLLLGGGVYAYTKRGQKVADAPKTSPAPKKKKINEPLNVLAVTERPYIEIIPKDVHNIVLRVNEVKKAASSADYELEYLTESNLEGAVGSFELGTLPAEREVLLGSCSAGGACRYHTNVDGGNLVLKFTGNENYALKQEWKYFGSAKKDGKFAFDKDETFLLESKDLAKTSLLVIYNTPGYPKTLSGDIASKVYSVTTSGTLKGKGTVSLQLNDGVTDATIMGWDGQSWKELTTKVTGNKAKAEGDLMSVYVAVKK